MFDIKQFLPRSSQHAAPAVCMRMGYRMYPQNCNAILKTLLALPAVAFAKSPRMDFLHKKERSGSGTAVLTNKECSVGYRMYPLQNCDAILETLLALLAVSFVKRPRMAVLRKKERSGCGGFVGTPPARTAYCLPLPPAAIGHTEHTMSITISHCTANTARIAAMVPHGSTPH